MFGIGPTEMLIVGIIAVILFGNRLPSVARSLGKSMTEFKKGMREFENEMHSSIYSDPPRSESYGRIEHQKPAADKPAEEQAGPANPTPPNPTPSD
ncbi:MAG: twin-arginine translocase TatA/TatE family subunit [Pirellulales bacterium]